MSDELDMELEILENELKEAQDAYETSNSQEHRRKLYGKIKRMEDRLKLLRLHSAIEDCRELELREYP